MHLLKFENFCISLIFIVGILSNSKAQTEFVPLKCTGKIPADFTTLSKVKSAIEIQNEKENYKANYSTNATKSEFISVSNYFLDELLLSGRVLFNDPLSDYLENILDIILVDEPDLKSKIRIYVLRSSSVNAFTTNNGMIFFTTGLLAEVENEAQLAFILAHEITHYEKRHVINSFLHQNDISNKGNNFRYNSYDDRIKAMSNYSKELEFQADSNSIHRLSFTKYSLKECINSMDVLQFSDLPFDEIKFNASIIEKGKFKFPSIFYLDSVTPINLSRIENENDSRSSHPNIKSRRERLIKYNLKLSSITTVEKFIQPKEKFDEIQNTARFETIRLMLNDRSYAETIYEVFILSQKDTNNIYFKKAIGKSLYGMAKYKTAGNYSETAQYFSKYEGEIQQCINLFYNLSKEQMNIIACRYLYDLSLETDSKFIKNIRDDIFIDLINLYEYNYDKIKLNNTTYFKKLEDLALQTKDTLQLGAKDSLVDEVVESKYDRLRKQKEKEVVTEEKTSIEPKNHEFYQGVFNDLILNDDFKNYVVLMESEAKLNRNSIVRGVELEDENKVETKKKSKSKEEEERERLNLGLEKVLIVDPFYFHVDRRKTFSILDSEEKLVNFSVDMDELSKKAGIENKMLAPKLFKEMDVNDYNDMAAINFWAGERLDHHNVRMIPLETDYIEPVVNIHGTNTVLFSGIYTYREKKSNIGLAVLASIFIYTAPFGIAYLAKPNMHTYYYTLLFNIENGNCYINETKHYNMNGKRGLIRSNIYDLMLQLKQPPKQ